MYRLDRNEESNEDDQKTTQRRKGRSDELRPTESLLRQLLTQSDLVIYLTVPLEKELTK